MSTRLTTFQPSLPTETTLREAALRHLARYAATSAGLARVLDRRVDRWLRFAQAATPGNDALEAQAIEARQAARRVVGKLVATGVVDDAAYAEGRARSLLRAGKSRRAVAQHLALRGIDMETLRLVLPVDDADRGGESERELAAALLLARKRRLGRFAGRGPVDPSMRRRALGMLARAGFSQDIAARALTIDPEEANERILRMRRGAA